MKNIHLIPTDKPSRLYEFGGQITLTNEPTDAFRNLDIYITSDEEIKDVRPHNGKWQLEKGQILNKFPDYLTDLSECKLVIMTTDQDLIKDGVQSIDDEFLEWFVKNPTCEEVEVKKLCQKEVISEWWENLSDEEMKEVFKQTGNFHLGGWGHDIGPTEEDVKDMYLEVHNLDLKKLNFNFYKIIIPNIWDEILNWVAQEEPKQGLNLPLLEQKLDEALSNETEESLNTWLKEKRDKQETLEEAAKRYASHSLKEERQKDLKMGFIKGARWQAEKMYTDKEVKNMLTDMSNFINTKELKDISDSTTYEWHRKRDWFIDYLIEVVEKNKKK